MTATRSTDWNFDPKVWHDHVDAYFRDKLVFGALADIDDTLKSEPGETINFPYFKSIGDVEEPTEDESLTVDKLEDDSFSATVKEVGKAIGFKDKAIYSSAARRDRNFSEAQRQMGRKFAEKMDDDLITEINTSGNYVDGFVGTANTDVCNVFNVNTAKYTSFGDRQSEAIAIYCHSLHILSLLNDSTSGFLKADATDPLWGQSGFAGRLLGLAVFESDKCPRGADLGGKKAYYSFICKPQPYGIITKQEIMFDTDRDILAREDVIAATQWYAVKAFHAKVATDDLRISRSLYATTVSA